MHYLRTREWFETRVPRAEQVIRRSLEEGRLDVGTLLHAMGQITDNPPDESTARLLSEALGVLPVDAFMYLLDKATRDLNKATRDLKHMASEGVYRAESRVNEGRKSAMEAEATVREGSLTVADIRATPHGWGGLIRTAALVQALVWAVDPPEEYCPLISY